MFLPTGLLPTLLLVVLPVPAVPGSTNGGVEAQVREALQVGREAPEQALAELRALGLEALEPLVTALDETALRSSSFADGSVESDPAEVSLIYAALDALPLTAVRAALEPAEELPAPARRARLLALSRGSAPADLRLAVRLAAPADSYDALGRALRTVATVQYERAPELESTLVAELRSAPAGLRESLLRALLSVERPGTLQLVTELLTFDPRLDPLLLGQAGLLGTSRAHDLPRELLAKVHQCLSSEDPTVLREAALALGRLDDFEGIDELIVLLEHGHAGVEASAQWSLEHISSLPLGREAYRWRAWHEQNRRWWLEDWPELRADLAMGTRGAVADAIREVAGRRYQRHEVARAVAEVLPRTNDDVLLGYACLALSALRSEASVEPLVELLHDSRAQVRDQAQRALERITDLHLPSDPQAWRSALAASPQGR
jgi:hypothetical protein